MWAQRCETGKDYRWTTKIKHFTYRQNQWVGVSNQRKWRGDWLS